MPYTALFYHQEIDICKINDIGFFVNNQIIDKNKISYSNRLFAYQTKENKLNLVYYILKEQTNLAKCSRCKFVCKECNNNKAPIDDWSSLAIESISETIKANEDYFNLEFQFMDESKIIFLNNKRTVFVEMPVFGYWGLSTLTDQELKKEIDEMPPPTVKSLENLVVDFYKWSFFGKILLIISGSKIIIWDLKLNDYKSVDLNNMEFEKLQLAIFDANFYWEENEGDRIFFTITLKSKNIQKHSFLQNFYLSIIFDEYLNCLTIVEEQRSQKVLILKCKQNKKGRFFFDLFTCGKRSNKHTTDFKFGMYKIQKDNQVIILSFSFSFSFLI